MMLGCLPMEHLTESLDCFIQLLRGVVFDLLVVDKPEIEKIVQAFEAYGTESGQSEEKLCEAAVLVRIFRSTVLVEARINFGSKQVDLGAILENANIWRLKMRKIRNCNDKSRQQEVATWIEDDDRL